jgi:NAD(P)-dependent dehydrogenase (short-subunit alcohol dehydrogenase family)
MLTMIRAHAVEMARYQVTANSILPGWIASDMTAAAIGDEKFAAAVLPRIPLRRWGKKEDFAGIAVYLMSDASGYHTGDHFVIDGAYTIF